MIAALDAGAEEIILGIGGSATVDCGCGCAQALGVEFYDAEGQKSICGLGGGGLATISSIDLGGLDSRIEQTRIRIACDVNNPLTGPEGAAAVYGPQKGATPEIVERLEAGMLHMVELVREQIGFDIDQLPGAGAAGGLGAGLVAFAGAELENGGKMIAAAVGLEKRLQGADLCITGEGKIDSQSASGKVPCRVAGIAGREGVSTVCISGMATEDAPRHLFREIRTLVSDEVTRERAMANPEELLEERSRQAMSDLMEQ
jgi:glycerate kinase